MMISSCSAAFSETARCYFRWPVISKQTATDIPLWWAHKGPRWPTGAPKLWASNDRRYASFQRLAAYTQILQAFVKERKKRNSSRRRRLSEVPFDHQRHAEPSCDDYMTMIANGLDVRTAFTDYWKSLFTIKNGSKIQQKRNKTMELLK